MAEVRPPRRQRAQNPAQGGAQRTANGHRPKPDLSGGPDRAPRRTAAAPVTSKPASSKHATAAPKAATARAAQPEAAASLTAPPGASFAELGLPARLVEALREAGIAEPFPIQSATLPDALAGRDVLGRGRTGSGKTLAFVLPVLARLAERPAPRRPGRPRALILAPTRELAAQIHDTLTPLARRLRLHTAVVFGGVGARPQISALRGGVDVLVACPGRLADHIGEGHAALDAVEITVLDEADHMADLGFLPAVKRLLDQTPATGQRLLFSATLDQGVDQLVKRYLRTPVTHSVDSAQSPVSTMSHHVLHIEAEHKVPVLVDLAAAPGRTIVFTRTKHGARKLARQLAAARIPAVELHGNLAHNARTRNLAAFTSGEATTLVATDIAARGIHVDDVALVVHADPPVEHKAYLHRSGRTARAGASGTVVTLMTDAQRGEVRDLTRKAGISPTTTRLAPGDPLLRELAPGERRYAEPEELQKLTGRPEDAPRSASGAVPRQRQRQAPATGSESGQKKPAERKPAQKKAAAAGASVPRQRGGAPRRNQSSNRSSNRSAS
jgi:superfamily II DNA/RNA helicase